MGRKRKKKTDDSGSKKRDAKKRKINDTPSVDTIKSDKMEIGNQEKKRVIKKHISFLNEFSEKTELDGFSPEQNTFFRQGKEIIRLRTNPPFYLRDDLNKIDDVAKYQFLSGKTDPQYIRSEKHPFWSKNSNKVSVFGRKKKNVLDANQGRFINTFTAITGKIGKKGTKHNLSNKSESSEGGNLYDQQLNYKNAIIKQIVTGVKDNELNITIGAYNDYPNLMVHLEPEKLLSSLLEKLTEDQLKKFVEEEKGDDGIINNNKEQIIQKLSNGTLSFRSETKRAFTLFMLSYYTGLVNKISEEKGLHVYMAERQSFGYASPSIAETIGSFRINIGLMPPEYADVHIEALTQFSGKLEEFKGAELPINPFLHKGAGTNDGKVLLHTATRSQHPKNNINAMAFNGQSIKEAMEKTMEGLNENSWNKETEKVDYETASSMEIEKAGIDETFYSDIIEPYQKSLIQFLDKQPKEDSYKELNDQFKNAIDTLLVNNVLGEIVEKFDTIQDYLATYALLKVADEKTFDGFGYGSESEAEGDEDERMELEGKITEGGKKKRDGGKLTIKKIITHNGMRALINPMFHEMDKLKTKRRENGEVVNADIHVNFANTYYEISDLLAKANFSKTPRIILSDNLNALILMRDANAIVIDGVATTKLSEELSVSESPVWIIDTTSATQQQMQEIVDKFRNNEKGEMLYLVSSGFKNEQGGADKNSYGTIRVVSKDTDAIDAALEAVKNTDGPLAEISHEYRRILKEIGMVPRDYEIIKRPSKEVLLDEEVIEEQPNSIDL